MKPIVFFCVIFFLFSCNKNEPQTDYLGIVKLEVSGTKTAIPHFEKGLLLLHSFEYVDARESFLKAQQVDPKMVMAYWGEAMTYNHSLWRGQDYLNGFSALEKLELQGEIEGQSSVEKDFLKAVEILYKPKTSKNDRDTAYMKYMEGLYKKYPSNHEVAAFYALSLLGSVAEGRNDSIYGLGADVANRILKENAKHPGALHYVIHSYDDPDHANLALDAANAYSQVAPDASHALHMPSHIYVAMGMWDEVVSSNINSYQASLNRMNKKELDNDARGYHAYHWLEYGYLQKGEIEKARNMVFEMEQFVKDEPSKRARVHMVFLKGTYLMETDLWEDPIANINIDVSGLNIAVRTQNNFINGMKAFKTGNLEEIDALIKTISNDIEKESLLVSNLSSGFAVCSTTSRETPDQTDIDESITMKTQLLALRAWKDKSSVEAEQLLKKAVELEKSMNYSYGPPFIQKPTHELYAEWLLENNRPEEAKVQYDYSLKIGTKRLMSLNGVKNSASMIANENSIK